MVSSYIGGNRIFEKDYLTGELEVELIPQVIASCFSVKLSSVS